MSLKKVVRRLPMLRSNVQLVRKATGPIRRCLTDFRSSKYWDRRYANGGDSGVGSYGQLAEFKARVLNDFVAAQSIRSVIEFGCGDGHQLSLAQYPCYVGIDVSEHAIRRCQKLFGNDRSKRFLDLSDRRASLEHAELALSLDVIYHLVEDRVYDVYMDTLFRAATRFVIIYSDDWESSDSALHVRHRKFTDWIELRKPDWKLIKHLPNQFPIQSNPAAGSWSDFWIYAPIGNNPQVHPQHVPATIRRSRC